MRVFWVCDLSIESKLGSVSFNHREFMSSDKEEEPSTPVQREAPSWDPNEDILDPKEHLAATILIEMDDMPLFESFAPGLSNEGSIKRDDMDVGEPDSEDDSSSGDDGTGVLRLEDHQAINSDFLHRKFSQDVAIKDGLLVNRISGSSFGISKLRSHKNIDPRCYRKKGVARSGRVENLYALLEASPGVQVDWSKLDNQPNLLRGLFQAGAERAGSLCGDIQSQTDYLSSRRGCRDEIRSALCDPGSTGVLSEGG